MTLTRPYGQMKLTSKIGGRIWDSMLMLVS